MNKIVREDIETIIASNCVDWKIFRDKTVLITGANGMLPSYMTLAFLMLNEIQNLNIKVIALVRNKQKAERVFKDFLSDDNLNILVHDVSLPYDYPNGIDYIIHAASQASPKYYGTDPVGTLNANILGTHFLLEYAKTHPLKGFLFFSTGGVYGNFPTDDVIIHEDMYGIIDPTHVRSCYFESKRMAENMCVCYAYQYKVPVKIIRIFHTLGPYMDINDGRAFSDLCKAVVNGTDIILKSDGSAKRTFCYVTDAIQGYFKVLIEGKNGEAYNVGSSKQEVSVIDLANELCSIREDKKVKVIFDIDKNSITYSKMKNPVDRVLPSTDKIESLGWKESTPYITSFKRTIIAKLIDKKHT